MRLLVGFVCIAGSALLLYNTYSEQPDLESRARAVACAKEDCMGLVGLKASVLGRSFSFQVKTRGTKLVTARCTRSLVLLGDYTCSRE